MPSRVTAKQAAVEQWTADPCSPLGFEGEPGSRAYFERLLRGRAEYAPWFAEALDYAGARGVRVLDVGCGQGIDLANYALNGAEVTGVDLTPRHVSLARQHLEEMGLRAEVREGDAEALPFEDSSYDRVSSNGVLHHTPNIDAALGEIRRVLRPEGEATVIVYNRRSFHYWIQQVLRHGLIERQLFQERSMAGVLARGVEISSIGARPLVRVYSPGQLRRMLTRAGFADVSAEVRHFHPGDTYITARLAHRPAFRRRGTLDWIGRVGGWYVIGRGRRPS